MRGRRLTRMLLIHAVAAMPLSACGQIAGPRDPLHFKDSGLYGGLPDPYLEGTGTPFNFLTIQCSPFQGQNFPQNNVTWNTALLNARQNGKRVIADFNPQALDANGQWFGIANVNNQPNPDAAMNQLVAVANEFFSVVNQNNLYGITLGEEQIFWEGREAVLNTMYDKMKAVYPNLPIFQWFTPSSTGTAPGFTGFPNLKSDGWVADEYFLDQPNMERNMRAYVVQQKSIIQTMFAGGSANNVPYSTARLNEQVGVLKKYDIPGSYFTFSGVSGGGAGWSPTAPAETKSRFQTVVGIATAAQSDPGPNITSWDTVPWELPSIELGFTTASDNIPSFGENYLTDRVLRFANDAKVSGFSNLRWDSSPVELRPRVAGAAQSSVSYDLNSAFPISQLRINAAGFITPGKNAAVSVSLLNPDGSVIQTANLNQGTLGLVVPGTLLVGREFKVVYNLSGTAAVAGDNLAGVGSFDVQADVIKPTNKTKQLQARNSGKVTYKQDLAAMSIHHTAQFTNPQWLVDSTSGLYVVTGGGTVEVKQAFHSPRDMTLSALRITGSADQPGAGGRVGVGVSLDGVNILASTMSSGVFNGTLTSNLAALANQIRAKDFFVHLILSGNYGSITGYSVEGTVQPLQIKNDFGTASQSNQLLWSNSAAPGVYSKNRSSSVLSTASAQDLPVGSTFTATDLDADGQAKILYMTGGSTPNAVTAVRPVSADPFKVFSSVTVSGSAAGAAPNPAANPTGVVLARSATGSDLSSYASSSQMQPVSVNGGASFDGTSRFWAGAKISNLNASFSADASTYSRFSGLQVTTDQRDPLPGERVLLTDNDFGTAIQQNAWAKTGTATPAYFSSDAGDVSNDLLASGIKFSGTTNTQRTGNLSLVMEVDAPAGKAFTNIVATADAWALSSWGSSAQLLLSRDGVNFSLAGNIASAGNTALSVSTAGVAGFEAMSSVWLKILMNDTSGFSIGNDYLRVDNLLLTSEMFTIAGSRPYFQSQWTVNRSGDWNTGTFWTGDGIPNSVDAIAKLHSAIGQNRSIFTNVPVTVGTLSFDNSNSYVISGGGSLTIDVSGGAGSIGVLSGSHKINLLLTLADSTLINVGTNSTLTVGNPTTLAGGIALVKSGAGTLTVQSTLGTPSASTLKINGGVVNLDASNNEADLSVEMDPASTLNLGADQTLGGMALSHGSNVVRVGRNSSGATVPAKLTLSGLTVSMGAGAPLDTLDQPLAGNTTKVTGVLQINAFSRLAKQGAGVLSVGSLNLASTAQLDLTDGKLMVDYSGASPLTNVLALLTSGRASGAWNGYGISSSTAATTAQRALGYVDTGITGAQMFGSESADGSAILIGYTVLGDATLDGTVNSSDFTRLAMNFNQAGQYWFEGDFNYDGLVNALDFNALASNFGTVASATALGAVVPEPRVGMLIAAAMSLASIGRKRR